MLNLVRPHRPGGALGLLALSLACGGVQANRREPGAVANGAFAPKRPAAARYGPDPSRTCPRTAVGDLLADELARAAKAAGKPAPTADGRLCAVAETFLGWTEEGGPTPQVIGFVSRYFGLAAPAQRVEISTMDSEEMKTLAGNLAEQARAFVASAAAPRYGFATDRLKKASTKAVLVLDDSPVELDPLPRRLAANEAAPVSGRLVGPYSKARLVVSDVAGKVTETKGAGKEFKGEVRCGDEPGRILVEVHGDDAGRPVATIPVACATALPTSVSLAAEAWPAELPEQEKKMAELINAERKTVALPALRWDEAVARVARSVSESLRDGSGANTSALIQGAGVATPVLLQNPGQARSAAEAHQGFLASPQHRANIMSPEVNALGIGIAAAKQPDGSTVTYVTQLFVKELQAIDTEAARTALRDAIARKRAAAGAPAPVADRALDELAQRYARALAAAEGGPAAAERTREMEAGMQSFRRVNVITGAKADPLELGEEPSLASGGKRIGVGVAQGKHPVLGPNASYVVVLSGDPREGTNAPGKKPAYLPRK